MTAPNEARRVEKKAALKAATGAVLVTLATVAGTLAFLHVRAGEQRRVLDERSQRCRADDAAACDLLRAACLRRSGDACESLADALLPDGPRHDPREAVRLLSDACTYHHRGACLRAARMHLEAARTQQPLDEARRLLARGCELGAQEACTLLESVRK